MKTFLRLAAAALSAGALATTAIGQAVAAETVPVYRIAGPDRIATAVAASRTAWDDAGSKDGPTATAAVISRYDDYADALGGSALAGTAGGPLLLTHTNYIDGATTNEVKRILGTKGVVYVLGSTGAISAAAAKSLADKGYTVKRLAGTDRYATSVEVAKEVGRLGTTGHPQFVFATTGLNFPDGLAAGATAAGYAAPVVLTKDSALPSVVKSYLTTEQAAGVDILAVGGATAKAPFRWAGTLAGKDRYETAALIARAFWADPKSTDDDATAIGLATGENWPDALAGGALMATAGPLVLSKQSSLPAATKAAATEIVKSANPSTVQVGFLLGGPTVVTDGVKNAFALALNS
ncbi:MAG TPA: cell wall-binding repeat-containing protein [Intrasporangium sp.]|nr:cell wall-binding repeat-containing protein [Intrasporangium sp.]